MSFLISLLWTDTSILGVWIENGIGDSGVLVPDSDVHFVISFISTLRQPYIGLVMNSFVSNYTHICIS